MTDMKAKYRKMADDQEQIMNDGAAMPVQPNQNPRVIDDDHGEITVVHAGRELRGWSYSNDNERRTKMLCAREYVEGWCDGNDAKTQMLIDNFIGTTKK